MWVSFLVSLGWLAVLTIWFVQRRRVGLPSAVLSRLLWGKEVAVGHLFCSGF